MLNWTFTRSNQIADLSGPDGTSISTTPPEPATPPQRPKIAIALGGGAARGWAHIGVLRALDEEGIDVGMIAGTSIGALVGGCYLAGKLDELEAFARSLTVRRIAGLLDFAIGGGGLFGGLRLTKRMQEHLQGLSIEGLDRPFIAVATEVHSGHEVWLEKGSLITAIRASYALPGIFEPIKANGRTLIDGALVNPVPVSVCRAHEQQLVVAVNLNYDLYGRSAVVKHSAGLETPDSPLQEKEATHHSRLGMTGVMVQAFNIIQDRISRARLAGDPPDLALHPKLNDIGLSEFHRAGEAIDRGYHEAKAKLAEIQRMQDALVR
ncbi:patatin-like phospholipase family protein [Ensifer sp. SSB1]|jgi:NTE family protein|uniref:patatin-like phospholipase family protein n=1 Tax=Ensifer sp. SSB1 TaxID=2795385 RepID=UPI000DE3D9CD|nr:patatin-like phospholipase family protein [Ensifer sp. SSB1]MBK5571119.1 patatin-like phospholipase family protein [Ensifer sp. SSB1]